MGSVNDTSKQYFDQRAGELFVGIGFGQVPGYRRIVALGNNPAVATTGEDIWPGGGVFPIQSNAVSLELLSSSASDTAAGVGARTVVVNGLNSVYVEQSEIVTLNGTTPVTLVNQFLRITNLIVLSAGSSQGNVGTITLRLTGGGVTQGLIQPLYGVSRSSFYCVPAGNALEIHSILSCINRNGGNNNLNATVATGTITPAGVLRLSLEFSISPSIPYRHDGFPGIIVPEKTDFFLRCTSTSANDMDITAAWLGIMKKL